MKIWKTLCHIASCNTVACYMLWLYIITFGVILPVICRDWIYSPYFSRDANAADLVKMADDKNTHRLHDATAYFNDVDTLGMESSKKNGDNLTIIIVTVERTKTKQKEDLAGRKITTGYLTQTMAALHELVSKDIHFNNKHIIICDVDKQPNRKEVRHLRGIFNVTSKYGTSNVSHTNMYVQELQDYTFCLRTSISLQSKYVMVLQDDALPRQNLFRELKGILDRLTPYRILHNEPVHHNIGYVSLYYPMKWSAYHHFNYMHLSELLMIGLCGGSIFILLSKVITITISSKCKPRCRHNPWKHTCQLFAWGFLYHLLLAIGLGRPYILNFVQYLPMLYHTSPAAGCCIQAVVYPKMIVKKLIPFLEHSSCNQSFPLDVLLYHYMSQNNLYRYLIEPHLVNHIGMVSTFNNHAKRAAEFIYI